MSYYVYAPDLMDKSKIAAALADAEFVRRPDDLSHAGAQDTVVVDLGRPGVLDAVRHLSAARVIGFGSHVDADLLDQARAAGCTEALPRSVFFRRLDSGL